MKIWKFRLEPFDTVKYDLPCDSEALSVLVQGDDIQLYVRMGDDDKMWPKSFACFPTGDSREFPGVRDRIPRGKSLGTVSVNGLVFHAWEVR